MICPTDVFTIIFSHLTIKEIFSKCLILSKDFKAMVEKMFPINTQIKQFYELFDIYHAECHHGIRPFIIDTRLLFHKYDHDENIGTFDYISGVKIRDRRLFMLNNLFTLWRIKKNKMYYHHSSIPDLFYESSILFEGTKYILVRCDEYIKVYKKRGNNIVFRFAKIASYMCIDESNDIVIYLRNHRLYKCYANDLSKNNIDLNETYITYQSSRPYIGNYIISEMTNGLIKFRLYYFNKTWKIYEKETNQFNIEDMIDRFIISYSINLKMIYLRGNGYEIIYSIESDKIIDSVKSNKNIIFNECGDMIFFIDYNEYVYTYRKDANNRYSKIIKCS